jgi:energy-coupling factor transport system ATP-binding protein
MDICLESGQVIALVGSNGAGKTTLLRVLAGLQSYRGEMGIYSGTASGNGALKEPQFGLVFQNPDLQFFNASVGEEIRYRLDHFEPAVYGWLLDLLGLRSYETVPPLLLSEGEKRRLALAIVLMRQPAHGILLDEPSLGQDAHHKAILKTALRRVAESGRLVILATHDLELASFADQILLLRQTLAGPGGLLASGPARQLFGNAAAWEEAGLRLPHWIGVRP